MGQLYEQRLVLEANRGKYYAGAMSLDDLELIECEPLSLPPEGKFSILFKYNLTISDIYLVILFCDRPYNGWSIATLRLLSHFASNNKRQSSIEYRERESHARVVYPTRDATSMKTARGRSRHQNNSKKVVRNLEKERLK